MNPNSSWHSDESVKKEVLKPIIATAAVIVLAIFMLNTTTRHLSAQNALSILNAADNFHNVNNITLHQENKTFKINSSNPDFNELKTLLNPVGEGGIALLNMDTSTFTAYLEIDYYIDNRLLLRATIFKIPDDFTPPEAYRYLLSNAKFYIGDNRGLVFLSDYNHNALSRIVTRTVPLGRLADNTLDTQKILNLFP